MAVISLLLPPEMGRPFTSAFATPVSVAGTAYPSFGWQYDPTADQAVFYKARAVNYGSGNITVAIDWYAVTATSGSVVWEAQLAAFTPNTDNVSFLTRSLATLNFVQTTHPGSTASRPQRSLITLSNLDSLAADDMFMLRVARDADGTNATDDMAGFSICTFVTLLYSDT